MARPRPATALYVIGALSIVVGAGTIGYSHYAVHPELRRTLEIARRATGESAILLDAASRSTRLTAELEGPTAAARRATLATMRPAAALLDAIARTVAAVPGTDDAEGFLATLGTLSRAVGDLAGDVREVHRTLRVVDDRTRRTELPPIGPLVTALTERTRELHEQLMQTNPARNTALFADLIAGLYVLLGLALIAVGRLASAWQAMQTGAVQEPRRDTPIPARHVHLQRE